MTKWFAYSHLPESLRPISRVFHELSVWMMNTIPAGPEATEAMRKLLESKDCAIRAYIDGQPTALEEPGPEQKKDPAGKASAGSVTLHHN